MVDPLISPAILGAACVVNLIAGPVGNRADWAMVASAKKVAAILRGGAPAENLYLMRATQAAYVSAMGGMADVCTRIALDDQEVAAAKALDGLVKRSEFKTFRFDGEHFPLAETNAAIDVMFAGGIGSLAGGGLPEAHRAYGRAVVADLAVWGVALPSALEALFVDGLGPHSSWHVTLRQAFTERIVHDREARAVFTMERLGEIRALGVEILFAVGLIGTRIDGIDADNARTHSLLEDISRQILFGGKTAGDALKEQESKVLAELKLKIEQLEGRIIDLTETNAKKDGIIMAVRAITDPTNLDGGRGDG